MDFCSAQQGLKYAKIPDNFQFIGNFGAGRTPGEVYATQASEEKLAA